MIGAALSMLAALGVYLIYTALAFGWRDLRLGPAPPEPRRWTLPAWMIALGPGQTPAMEFWGVLAGVFVVGTAAAFVLFGGLVPALVAGIFAASWPAGAQRARRARRRQRAREAWPRMIEEVRLLTSALGRSVPQALLEVGRRGPEEMREAFAAAEREWSISTDFARTAATLKAGLADASADAACETLLVAHEVGGSDLDRRLTALAEDRIQDLEGRKDAEAKQSGVRFARRFVLVVPIGMALAGLSIGTGRDAYRTPLGQLLVVIGILVVIGCWLWAGHLMKLPEEERVFS